MTIPAAFAILAGQWTGANRLWLDPEGPARDSTTTLRVAPAGRGHFLTFTYAWAEGGKPQDGLLVIGLTPDDNVVHGTWLDSFHMGDQFMALTGSVEAGGRVALAGSYAAPPGPDWGWQITLAPVADGGLQILMHNVQPGEAPQLAVEAAYTR